MSLASFLEQTGKDRISHLATRRENGLALHQHPPRRSPLKPRRRPPQPPRPPFEQPLPPHIHCSGLRFYRRRHRDHGLRRLEETCADGASTTLRSSAAPARVWIRSCTSVHCSLALEEHRVLPPVRTSKNKNRGVGPNLLLPLTCSGWRRMAGWSRGGAQGGRGRGGERRRREAQLGGPVTASSRLGGHEDAAASGDGGRRSSAGQRRRRAGWAGTRSRPGTQGAARRRAAATRSDEGGFVKNEVSIG